MAGRSPPFSLFVELLDALGEIPPRKIQDKRDVTKDSPAAVRFVAWVNKIKAEGYEPERWLKHFFRMFFPDEGVRRRCASTSFGND